MFIGTASTPKQSFHAWYDSLFRDHAVFRLFWTNTAPVIPGRVWRCNHPTPRRFVKFARELALQNIINLRGHRQCGSDALGRRICQKLALPYHDMAFESRNAPHKERILRFYNLYTTLSSPILLHCKSGADRAGLASGLVVLFEGGTAQDALKQLHWRFLHFRTSRTGILDAFFLLYQKEAEGRLPFMDWIKKEYDEDRLRTEFRTGLYHPYLKRKISR